MDSSDHQPYKSRLFNFLNRQSWRWRDRLVRGAQYLRIGVEWSVQVLVYPLYLMVQGGRATRKQLRQSFFSKALPSSNHKKDCSSPQVDRPLRRVFEETEHCLSQTTKTGKLWEKSQVTEENIAKKPVKTPKNSLAIPKSPVIAPKRKSQTSPILIQGVASDLESHNLVLVAEKNAIIDILSQTQQNHLKRYIRLETANYWYDLKQKNLQPMGLMPTFSREYHQVLPPVRWFWQLMRWMQTGTLATTLDFFGESALVPIVSTKNLEPSLSKSLVAFKDSEKQSLLSPVLNQKIQQWGESIRHKSNESLNIHNEDPFRLEFLIYAAIDYFLNQIGSHSQLEDNLAQKYLSSATLSDDNLIDEKIDDPWLSWDDLYGEPFSVTKEHSQPYSPAFLPQAEKLPRKQKKYRNKTRKNPVKTVKNSKSLVKGQVTAKKLNSAQTSFGSDHINCNNKIESVSSQWLETEGTTTGYVKHPLVRVLEWLDTAIHWLEQWAKKLGKLLRK